MSTRDNISDGSSEVLSIFTIDSHLKDRSHNDDDIQTNVTTYVKTSFR